MTETATDQEIDQLVWSIVQHSTNPHDHLNYVRHAQGRAAGHAAALMAATQRWGDTDAPVLFNQAVSALQALAQGGADGAAPTRLASQAMFHLARWHRLGYGVAVDTPTGIDWYRRGAELGDTRCLINLGRYTAERDVPSGMALFERAAALGNASAYCFMAHHDKDRFEQHMLAAVQDADPFSLCYYGFYLCNRAGSDADRASHRHWIERAAELGETEACNYLGVGSAYGRHGMTRDHDAARYWLRKGARFGGANCMFALGRLLLDLGEDEVLEAMVCLHHASMLGDARAQAMLGGRLLWSSKTAQAQTDGIVWLRASAAQNQTYGIYLLAESLRNGRGTEVDLTEAAHWYQKGADNGDSDCQAYLGLAYNRGAGVEQDMARAHNLFSIASLQGNAWATFLLGLTFECAWGTERDPKAAFDCFMQAANGGESRAAYRVGYAYLTGVLTGLDKPAAVRWLRKAAALGNADAKTALGLMLLNGDGVEVNATEALKWLRQAAAQDDARALREIGLLYACGDAVDQDMEQATRYMGRAASQGDQQAVAWLDAHCPKKPQWLDKLLTFKQEDGQAGEGGESGETRDGNGSDNSDS